MTVHKTNSNDLAINGGKKCFDSIKTTMNFPAPKYDDFHKKLLKFLQMPTSHDNIGIP